MSDLYEIIPELADWILAQRDDLLRWAEKKGTDSLERFQQKHNLRSLDDLPTPQ